VSPTIATQEFQSYVYLNLTDCARAYDEFEKVFRRFVDRSVDGTVRGFDRDSFGVTGEIQMQLLNQRLDRWKNLVFNAVEFSLYVILTFGLYSELTTRTLLKTAFSLSVGEYQPGAKCRTFGFGHGEGYVKNDKKNGPGP
jgi:hypothetical protein